MSSLLAGLGGRLLGLEELFLLAAAAAALLLGALAYVRAGRFVLSARRLLVPGRLPAGASCRVELTVTNGGRRPSPVLLLADGSHRPFLLAPLEGGEQVETSYRLGDARRGLHPVGPLCVRLRDPFGLASRSVAVLAPSTLTVHPRIDSITLPPEEPGGSAGGPRRAAPAPLAGTDFHALRPYEEGDDLRLVHWPTSARLDALVVRQEEAPRRRQTALAVDLRRSIHDAATLERVVSAAASLAAAACEEDGVVRLVTTGGSDSGNAGGERHLASVVDALATVGCDTSRGLGGLARALGDGEAGMAVLITTSAASADDLGIVARLRPQYPMIVAVVFERAADERLVPHPAAGAPFDRLVRVGPGVSFRQAWGRSVSAPLVDG